MKITFFDWDEENIDHVAHHGVNPEEVEEACGHKPYVLKGRMGTHLIYSQTSDGRFLLVVAKYQGGNRIRPITARDMTDAEKKFCQERRKG